ncbi:MAG: magnesium-translocating P-type ATPase, partial [bacterium]
RGLDTFTWLMIGFMAVMAPTVFVINGLSKGNWLEAFFFALAVTVGLTPEMLPAIVTVNLSKGAISMSKKKVIVKRLSSIQNLGAMDVLCTDKTGTLTQNKVVLIKSVSIDGSPSDAVFEYAFINSSFQTGFTNLLDDAVVKHAHAETLRSKVGQYRKIDEVPFDFKRRRLSIVVKDGIGKKLLICKGAVEEVSAVSTSVMVGGKAVPLSSVELNVIRKREEEMSLDGFRLVAVAYKEIDFEGTYYTKDDEKNLTFLGIMAFLDPPKESAAQALAELAHYGLAVKVLTGDNELVTKKICREVQLPIHGTLLGPEIEKMSEDELKVVVETTTVFAKLSPEHKRRIVEALQKNRHVVGFLGDGINDAPALRVSDVGISVNTAVDIAKESADIILMEMSLLVLKDGVLEGRKVFGNVTKYIRMGASSNFGNMFSVIGASIFLPFLPMLPLQLLVNNLLYDFSQTTIPTDTVDDEYIQKPKKWQIGAIRRFMFCIGPISSIFDYTTFFVMLFVFNAWQNPALFQTGWFVESLLTQTLIVHVIRSRRIPFVQAWASKPLIATTVTVMVIGVLLTLSPLAPVLGFVRLPLLYWPVLGGILVAYVGVTQVVKMWYSGKWGYE